MQLEVVLVVVATGSGNSMFMVTDDNGKFSLPHWSVPEDQSSFQVASKMLKTYTGIEARFGLSGWADLVPFPVSDAVTRTIVDHSGNRERLIAVPYGCLLPLDVCKLTTENGYRWVFLGEILKRGCVVDHQEILLNVCKGL